MDHDDVGSAPLLAGNAKLAFYLAVILFFAVALRIFCFTGMSGSDDIDYNREAHYVSIGEFESRLLDRSRSPSLYINTLRVGLNFPVALFFRLGGVNEITSILVPFLCSLGLISLSFLGGRLFFDTNTGLMAAPSNVASSYRRKTRNQTDPRLTRRFLGWLMHAAVLHGGKA